MSHVTRITTLTHRWTATKFRRVFTSRYFGGKGSAELDMIASDKGLESDEVLRYVDIHKQ